VSDGTGRTAEQLLKSALVQFAFNDLRIEIRPYIRTSEQLIELIKEVFEHKGFIIHTLVSNNMRNMLLELARLHEIQVIDVMGPVLAQLTHQFENLPLEKPGIFHTLNKAYFQRIDAIEFAIRHDDGLHTNELIHADIVLLGVSRTFKTPLSVYLAHKGWKTANIPIILNMPLPSEVYDVSPKKVFFMTTNPLRLSRLRRIRNEHLKGFPGEYSEFEYVKKELSYAYQLFKKNPGWTLIDVTNRPIEEISSRVLHALRENHIGVTTKIT
jgi:regulator of PEP synthase PpsR (kinase-PPPase family)